MEFRQLRYFLAVAEHLNFTRAAEQLRIAQPPLSQQIQKLEHEVGVPLFVRHSRGVELTQAGEMLLPRARSILQQSQQALAEAQQAARGEIGKLSIGFAGSVGFFPTLPKIVHHFRQRWPEVQITSEENDSPGLVEKVHNHELDCAFVRQPVDCFDLHKLVIAQEPLMALLPPEHRLADNPVIELHALKAEPFILFPRKIGPLFYDLIMDSCKSAGFVPEVVMHAPQVSSSINMVAAGFGISIVPESMQCIHVPGVTYHRIEPLPAPTTVTLIYRQREHAATINNFLAIAKQLKEDQG